MEDYDVLLHLNPSLLPRSTEAVDWQSKGLEDSLRFRNVRDSVYGEGIRIAFDPHESFALDVQVRSIQRQKRAPANRSFIGALWRCFHGVFRQAWRQCHWPRLEPCKADSEGFQAFLGVQFQPHRVRGQSSKLPSEAMLRVSQAALVSINREAVLGEIARLGNGLIRSISLKQAGENNHR